MMKNTQDLRGNMHLANARRNSGIWHAGHSGTGNRQFGLVMGIVFLLISIFYWFFKHQDIPVLAVISLLFIGAALFAPRALTPLNWGWTKLSLILGTVNTWILLMLLYFIVLTPLGLIMKILGKDPLKLQMQHKAVSYWNKATVVEGSSMKKQY